MIATVLGLGWGVLAAAPIVARARRRVTGARADRLGGGTDPAGAAPASWVARVAPIARRLPRPPRALAHVVTGLVGRARARRTEQAVVSDLPVTVDLLAVAVASGCTPYLAVEVAERWSPPTSARLLGDVRRASLLGRPFEEALDRLVAASPALAPVVDALLVSDRFGAPVGDALTRVGAELRADLRRRAETRARTIPVRLLFPLVFLVLPAFGLLTVVPAVVAGLAGS